MNNETKILLGVAGAVLTVVVGVILVGGSKEAKPVAAGDKLVRDDSYQTAKGAPVTLVEFGDFQCPACAAAEPTLQKLRETYAGKVNFVFRNFPLRQIHKNAEVASMAAEAAGAQGKYWEFHDKLYANQKNWESQTDPVPLFVEYAKQLALDVEKFRSEVKDRKYIQKINRDFADGEALNVQGTPTFYVNGQQQKSVSDLPDAIQAALPKQ